MSSVKKKFCPYSLDITLSGVTVLIRGKGKTRNTEVKMKFFIPYERMLEEFPRYVKPREDHLICTENEKLYRVKGFPYDYGEGRYGYGDREYRKMERWEWDLHSFLKRSPQDHNAKFFKTVQDAYKSQFGE